MYKRALVFCCKLLILLLRAVGRNGSALPGLIIERLYPTFLSAILSPVEKQVIIVTGTNGKTTTTKMLVAGLRGAGKRVVTNSTGSNMTRGLISALVEDMTLFGSLKPTDWFVFEMDEAYGPLFTSGVSPKAVVGLNVLRDQLDRYGEVDTTARLIQKTASRADIFVYNQLDPLLLSAAAVLSTQGVQTSSFGVSAKLASHISNEESLQGKKIELPSSEPETLLFALRETQDTQTLTIQSDSSYAVSIPVKGFHNALNATAVTAMLEQLLNKSDISMALDAISKMQTPFGRGERLHFNNKTVTVALVKNPSGFTNNLKTFVVDTKPDAIIFVINDDFADGRDVSWLWDVSFKDVLPKSTKLFTSGIRRYDMALRLKHDGFMATTEPTVPKVLQTVLSEDVKNVVIIPTYTALFEVRSALSKYVEVPRIW